MSRNTLDFLADVPYYPTEAMEKKGMSPSDMPDMMETGEVALRLGRSTEWVRRNAKRIPGYTESFPGSGQPLWNRAILFAYYHIRD